MNQSNKKLLVNMLTILRIIGIPVIFMLDDKLILFIYVNFLFITDFLDGYYARKWKTETNFGAILDLIADKFLVVFLLSFGLFADKISLLLWLLIVGREFYSIILRIITMKKKAKLINASYIGKIKTTFQFIALDALILDLKIATLLLWIVVVLSYWSILKYRSTAKEYHE